MLRICKHWGALTLRTMCRRWDAWARMHQPLFSRVPLLHCPGNHESEVLLAQGNTAFQGTGNTLRGNYS